MDYTNTKENEDDRAEEGLVVSKQKLAALKSLANNLRQASEALSDFLSGFGELPYSSSSQGFDLAAPNIDRVVEGVFDGEKMIGSDGKTYLVPMNYASKSKLVEGDGLKLSVTDKGTLIYKQILPVERLRLTGGLEKSETGDWTVQAGAHRYRVLGASVTYFKGDPGDEAVILVPKTGQSHWAAVEHIFKKS